MSANLHHLFYCDDDEDDREIFSVAVKSLGLDYPVELFSNVDDLINTLTNPPPEPSVVFLDINMPRRTGLDALRELRSSSRWKNMKVVMLTTSATSRAKNEAQTAGADAYMVKPTSFPEFVTMLQKVLAYPNGPLYNSWDQLPFDLAGEKP